MSRECALLYDIKFIYILTGCRQRSWRKIAVCKALSDALVVSFDKALSDALVVSFILVCVSCYY
jgi:hypothetical protein